MRGLQPFKRVLRRTGSCRVLTLSSPSIQFILTLASPCSHFNFTASSLRLALRLYIPSPPTFFPNKLGTVNGLRANRYVTPLQFSAVTV